MISKIVCVKRKEGKWFLKLSSSRRSIVSDACVRQNWLSSLAAVISMHAPAYSVCYRKLSALTFARKSKITRKLNGRKISRHVMHCRSSINKHLQVNRSMRSNWQQSTYSNIFLRAVNKKWHFFWSRLLARFVCLDWSQSDTDMEIQNLKYGTREWDGERNIHRFPRRHWYI